MNKARLIKALSRLISEIVDRPEEDLNKSCEERKLRFRQYDFLHRDSGQLQVLDFTIEF